VISKREYKNVIFALGFSGKGYNWPNMVSPLLVTLKYRSDGEIYGFLGLNGAGKTTTIRMLACLIRPTAGTARVNGYELGRDNSHIRRICGMPSGTMSAIVPRAPAMGNIPDGQVAVVESQARPYYRSFPAQLWVLVVGGFISSLGSALVLPFLTLYLRQRLGISLFQVGLVFTVNAIATLCAGMLGGLIADRFGRRSVMLVSLLSTSVVLFLMGVASTYGQIVLLNAALG